MDWIQWKIKPYFWDDNLRKNWGEEKITEQKNFGHRAESHHFFVYKTVYEKELNFLRGNQTAYIIVYQISLFNWGVSLKKINDNTPKAIIVCLVVA